MSSPPDPGTGFRAAELVRRHGLAADKRLGQHFLLDPGILRRIAAAAAPFDGRVVLEVGPGPGGLTSALLEAGAEVVAVERDARFIPALAGLAAAHPGRLRVLEADAAWVDTAAIGAGRPVVIVANLPYNVGTHLLLGWLERLDGIESMVLMFQREVALRLAAFPGGKEYGRLAVLAGRLCTVRKLFDLAPGAFLPPPKVSSSVVRLVPRPDRPAPPLRAALARVTAAAFGQRRKMLRSSLRTLVPEPERLLEAAGIAPTRRAEELAVVEFERLAQAFLSAGPGATA